jgi:hypothetical protein
MHAPHSAQILAQAGAKDRVIPVRGAGEKPGSGSLRWLGFGLPSEA